MSKPFVFDLKKFKKVGSEGGMTTLKHPDGHSIKIAHKSLSPKMRSQLADLPMALAEGGEVGSTGKSKSDVPEPSKKGAEDVQKGATESGWQPEKWKKNLGLAEGGEVPNLKENYSDEDENADILNSANNFSDGGGVTADSSSPEDSTKTAPVIVNVNNSGASQTPQQYAPVPAGQLMGGNSAPQQPVMPEPTPAPPVPETPAPQPAVQNPGAIFPKEKPQLLVPGDTYGTQTQGNQFTQGLEHQQAGIQSEAIAATIKAEAEQKVLQKAVEKQQSEAKSYQEHYAALDGERKAFQKDVIDQHIDPQHYLNSASTGQKISNAIGLILGGIGGGRGENPALAFLNAQIDRDIAAQRAELGKKESLLSANMRQFGNLNDATNMTRVMQTDIVANKLKEAAAKTTDEMVKARALQAAGALEQQSAPQLGQIAMRQSLLSGAKAGKVEPERVILALVPQHEQAAATKALQEARNMTKAKDTIMNAFNQLAGLDTVGNRISSPIQTPKQVAAIKDPIIASLSKATAGRFTEADAKMVAAAFPKYGDDAKTLEIKRRQLNAMVSEKMNFPELTKWGIDPSTFGLFNEQGSSKIPYTKPKSK